MAAEALHIKQTEDRFENMDLGFHERLRKGFLEIARKNKKRIHVVNAENTPEEISEQILKIIQKKLRN